MAVYKPKAFIVDQIISILSTGVEVTLFISVDDPESISYVKSLLSTLQDDLRRSY